MNNITIDNFGGNGYIALNKDENFYKLKSCMIKQKNFTPITGSIIDNSILLDDNCTTKFYVLSVSVIGLYIFHSLLLK
jgi:hypothetical protein